MLEAAAEKESSELVDEVDNVGVMCEVGREGEAVK